MCQCNFPVHVWFSQRVKQGDTQSLAIMIQGQCQPNPTHDKEGERGSLSVMWVIHSLQWCLQLCNGLAHSSTFPISVKCISCGKKKKAWKDIPNASKEKKVEKEEAYGVLFVCAVTCCCFCCCCTSQHMEDCPLSITVNYIFCHNKGETGKKKLYFSKIEHREKSSLLKSSLL